MGSRNESKAQLTYFIWKLGKYWHLILASFLCDSFITIVGMIPPLFSVLIFDYAYPHRDLNLFTIITIAIFVIYFLDFIFSAFIDYINIYIHQNFDRNLTMDLFKKIEELPLKFLNRKKIGDLTVRLTEDIGEIVRFCVNVFSDISTNLIKLGIFLYISLNFNYKITLLSLLSIPFYLLETKYFSKKLESVHNEMKEADSNIIEEIQTKLINIRTIKAFNQQRNEAEKLGVRLRKSFMLTIKESLISISHAFTNSLTIQVWSTFVAWFLGYEVISGRLTIGEVIALGIYLPLLEGPIRNIASLYNRYRITKVSSRRVLNILNASSEKSTQSNAPSLNISKGAINFKDITFAYETEAPALKDFSLSIPEKASVAIVGDSGSGKTTILNLLLRLYAPQNGTISIDGIDISKVNINSLRENLGVVFQETTVIPGTIRENILYGLDNRPDQEVIDAAEEACAHEFIINTQHGYETEILPQGKNLSAGQKQRIAIARILLRNPKILVLDEPTSALDSANEFFIQEAINKIIGTRTLIIIAHNLSNLKKIDKIIVLSAGQIAEEGKFQELMNKKGEFYRLYNLYYGGFQKFLDEFNTEFQRVLRYGQDLSLAMLEIPEYNYIYNKYKPINATRFIEEVSLFIKKQVRVMDLCSIYTGNKIVLAMPETDINSSILMLNRLSNSIRDFYFKAEMEKIGATLKAGIVSCKEIRAQYGEDLFDIANKLLLNLKAGENFNTFNKMEKNTDE
ncbi:ATP-binding cassette domain-containing protein [bacterium]|nr:ATP-binding cassette domain-containing protein [bacterium]